MRIRDNVVWIRIRRYVPLTKWFVSGAGSCYFRQRSSGGQQKIIFFQSFFAYYFLKLRVHLHHFSKIKGHKKSQNRRNQGFSFFCMMIEGSRSLPRTNGSGSAKLFFTIMSCIHWQLKDDRNNSNFMADFDPSTSRREKQKLTKKFNVVKNAKSTLYDSKVSFKVWGRYRKSPNIDHLLNFEPQKYCEAHILCFCFQTMGGHFQLTSS